MRPLVGATGASLPIRSAIGSTDIEREPASQQARADVYFVVPNAS
jgi:hypothetical protein